MNTKGDKKKHKNERYILMNDHKNVKVAWNQTKGLVIHHSKLTCRGHRSLSLYAKEQVAHTTV